MCLPVFKLHRNRQLLHDVRIKVFFNEVPFSGPLRDSNVFQCGWLKVYNTVGPLEGPDYHNSLMYILGSRWFGDVAAHRYMKSSVVAAGRTSLGRRHKPRCLWVVFLSTDDDEYTQAQATNSFFGQLTDLGKNLCVAFIPGLLSVVGVSIVRAQTLSGGISVSWQAERNWRWGREEGKKTSDIFGSSLTNWDLMFLSLSFFFCFAASLAVPPDCSFSG